MGSGCGRALVPPPPPPRADLTDEKIKTRKWCAVPWAEGVGGGRSGVQAAGPRLSTPP